MRSIEAQFRDRTEAGQLLAEKLISYAKAENVLVLALPRGGVPVGFQVARALHVPLDILVVRKLGLPGREELAMGAIASGGVRILNKPVIRWARVSNAAIDAITAREQVELERRELAYRGHASAPQVSGKIIVLIDDGIATEFIGVSQSQIASPDFKTDEAHQTSSSFGR
jgi:putative phosphoribosyl transferase